MPAAVQFDGVTKTYKGRAAVDGLDLTIRQGEIFSFLGPNGAGKTTSVEIAEGFRRPDAGTVRVLGQDPWQADRSWRARIGIVLQTSGGLDLLTPREAITSLAKAYQRSRDVLDVIDVTGLTEKADDRIGTLSGGQRRRLDVALGIVGRPELMFLDEPTTGFDPQARRDFWTLIRTLADEGTTILLTTHYLEEAEALADRVGVIAAGRLLALDTPANLGGRAAAQATVSWSDGGTRRTVVTDSPTQVVRDIADTLTPGAEIPELTITRPSLEDTYLSLIRPHASAEDPS